MKILTLKASVTLTMPLIWIGGGQSQGISSRSGVTQ